MEFQIVDVVIDVVSFGSRIGVHLAHDGFATTILSLELLDIIKKIIFPFFGNVSIGSIFMDKKKTTIRVVFYVVSMDWNYNVVKVPKSMKMMKMIVFFLYMSLKLMMVIIFCMFLEMVIIFWMFMKMMMVFVPLTSN